MTYLRLKTTFVCQNKTKVRLNRQIRARESNEFEYLIKIQKEKTEEEHQKSLKNYAKI